MAPRVMEKYYDIGTSVNINILNWLKGLPTKNFLLTCFPEGEKSAARFLRKSTTFAGLLRGIPIDCVHIAALKTAFSTYYEFKVRKVSYDYEPIYSLGSNMGVGQAEGVLQLIDVCERLVGVSCLRDGPLLGYRGPGEGAPTTGFLVFFWFGCEAA